MFSSPVEEIKNRLDIVEVVGSYIKLQKAGANYRAACPFHSEKKPSFFVSPTRQSWHCFGGCGEGGDMFKFVMKIEGIEFGDALRILAQKAGVVLKKQDPQAAVWQTERNHLYEICELACSFFEKQLTESATGREAQEYLKNRGINQDSLKKWRVGYAPDAWQGLSNFLISRGYAKAEIQGAGLALSSSKGSFFDRFRGRIIFPVFDLNSQVVGFGGRVFKSDDPAKYVNTPSTLLYDKGRTLYGLDKAKLAVRKQDACILVEGYVDAIMCSQAGFENVVAVSGTALTLFQLKILKRYSDNLLTAFDMDLAGDSATKRGIEMAKTEGFNIKVAVMPQGNDPADIVLEDARQWVRIVNEAKSIMQFLFEASFGRFDAKTPEGKREISKALLPAIKRISNKIERFHWLQELAHKLGVREEVVEQEMEKTKIDQPNYYFPENIQLRVPVKKTRKDILGERIVSLVLQDSQALELLNENHYNYLDSKLRDILDALKSGRPHTDAEFVNYLALRAEMEEGIDGRQEIMACLKELENLEIKKKLDDLSYELKAAEYEKNMEKVDGLMKEFHQLANKLTK